MGDVEKKLDTLIAYWVEHNQEHEREFHDWASLASAAGDDVSELLVKAAGSMADATSWLERARQALNMRSE
ncbi:MAG: hypothetical protein ABID84_05525 [Chloroflexota bacterium]